MPSSTPEQYCPLCQQLNLCGVDSEAPCWCTTKKFPAILLEQVPKKKRRKACICQSCVEKFNHDLGTELK